MLCSGVYFNECLSVLSNPTIMASRSVYLHDSWNEGINLARPRRGRQSKQRKNEQEHDASELQVDSMHPRLKRSAHRRKRCKTSNSTPGSEETSYTEGLRQLLKAGFHVKNVAPFNVATATVVAKGQGKGKRKKKKVVHPPGQQSSHSAINEKQQSQSANQAHQPDRKRRTPKTVHRDDHVNGGIRRPSIAERQMDTSRANVGTTGGCRCRSIPLRPFPLTCLARPPHFRSLFTLRVIVGRGCSALFLSAKLEHYSTLSLTFHIPLWLSITLSHGTFTFHTKQTLRYTNCEATLHFC